MPLEGLGSPVGVVATDLTVVVDVQAVQLVEPIWNRLEGTTGQLAVVSPQFRHCNKALDYIIR